MALSKYYIKKWYRMISGKSILHVNQGIGKTFSKDELYGYYNDLTEKISPLQKLDDNGIPLFENPDQSLTYFPTCICQYGLGAFDLYLIKGDLKYFETSKKCANWIIDNMEENGALNTFSYEFPSHPYSSMAQGEACSLLLRVFKETKDTRYFNAAKKAIDFMLLPIEKGGTCLYEFNDVIFKEYTHEPTVLNGWIFSIFGLYDFTLVSKSSYYIDIYEKTMKTILRELDQYDVGYWSKYDCNDKIASPFYHKLHIAQLDMLYELSDDVRFYEVARKFELYQNNKFYYSKAFVIKALQKLKEV